MDARLGKLPLNKIQEDRIEANPAIDPARALGLEEGDAHVIRNAGGRTVEAIRSLVISQQLLGTREIVIVHHVCPLFSLSPPESRCQVDGVELH